MYKNKWMTVLPKFTEYHLIVLKTGKKLQNLKFCMHIHRIDRNKSPLKISGKVAVDILRDSQNFLQHPCVHRAVIFVTAQLSCLNWF